MPRIVVSVENLTKKYDLGVISSGTLQSDLNRWFARLQGKPDPDAVIGKSRPSKFDRESILALENVSFTVEQGEALGIIGRNGAGKSTLLKILSQVTAPTIGEIKIKGRIGSLLEVGTGFHPELTGRENVYLNGAILGMTKAEVDRKFDEIVDFSGVEKFIDTPVKRYSSGMKVRLGFAVAAHLDPEILIIDEVLAVGDAEFQKKCLGKMGDVTGEGRTVLFVSHNMQAVQNLCNRAIILDQGNIQFCGMADNAISTYLQSHINSNNTFFRSEGSLPGNDSIDLVNTWIKNINLANNYGSILIEEDIEIGFEFIYHETKINNNINFLIHLENEDGIRVLTTSSRKSGGYIFRNGRYRAKCIIPANLLNHGVYTITDLRFFTDSNMRIFECKNILTFNLRIKNENRFGWFGKSKAILRPNFDWILDQIE